MDISLTYSFIHGSNIYGVHRGCAGRSGWIRLDPSLVVLVVKEDTQTGPQQAP